MFCDKTGNDGVDIAVGDKSGYGFFMERVIKK